MSDHWTRIAAERIEAGEDEIECLADYGYVPAVTLYSDEIISLLQRLVAQLGNIEAQLREMNEREKVL